MDNLTIFYIASFGMVYLIGCWALISFGRGGLLSTFGYLGAAVPLVGGFILLAMWLATRFSE